MGLASIPLSLTDVSRKVEEGAIEQGKRDTKAYVDAINAEAASKKAFYDATIERLKKLGPLPGIPKIPISNELPSTAGPVIAPAEDDPKRNYDPLGASPRLTQRDIQGDPQPAGGVELGTGGPDDPGGPPAAPTKPAGEAPPPKPRTPVPPYREAYKGLEYAPPANWKPATDKPGMDQMLGAAWDNILLNQNLNSDEVALDRAYGTFIRKGKELGLNAPENPVSLYRAMQFNNTWPYTLEEMRANWHEQVRKQLEGNPELAAKLGAVTKEALGGMADQLSRDAYEHYSQLKEARGEGFWSVDTLAEFGTGMGASLTDPFQAATAPIGGPSKTILGAAVKGAAVNAAIDLMMEPAIQSRQLRLGNIKSWEEGVANAMANVTISGALGFTLSGGEKALEKLFTSRGHTPRPEAQAEFEHAREAMTALAADIRGEDPDTSALVRKAMADAERDFSTAQQIDDRLAPDEFARAIEDADAQVRALQEFTSRPEIVREAPETRLDTTDEGPTPKVGEHLTEDGKPVTFTQFDPRELKTAPDEFQYKRFSGEEGVNGAIADVETWHAPSSGKILVFERANGERVIADGHQRRSKAVSIMQGQGREDIRLDGYLYKETDGWTPADLRLKGAQKNIREGRSDVLDTAQALRERPDAIDSSFPLSRSNIRQARQLARLSPEAWDLTRAGVLDPHYAALIGQVAPDRPGIHAPLARTLIEAAPDNVRQAESIVSEALLDYAERDTSTQASLFGDDNLGRGVMYKERAQIMDAAYSWLRSERSVFKALVEKGDIARALGNELVDAANLNAKDQVELAIAAVMHSRRAGVRTAVSDMVSRALDSVRREGVPPTRAGQQVAREIRALVEERGFRALLEAEGPRPPEMAEAGPLFDGPGTPAHVAQADMLEGDLRPEGLEDPGVDLAKVATPPDPVDGLVAELKGAGEGGDRTPDQILGEIRKLLQPPERKSADTPLADVHAQIQEEFKKLEQTEKALREALLPLTDEQKISLIRMQYPDSYAVLNRLTGADLDDAIVGRVMAGEIKYSRRGGPDTEITYKRFHSDLLSERQNKIIEMAQNGFSNMEIGIEVGVTAASVKVLMNRAKKKLDAAGIPYKIEPGATGQSLDGHAPGALKSAIFEMLESNLDAPAIAERLAAMGMHPPMQTIYVYTSKWRAAKANGIKYSIALKPLVLGADNRIYSPGSPDPIGFITSAERALADPPPRFRDAKKLTADQWRKLMREGGASKEAFTYQIEPALKAIAEGRTDPSGLKFVRRPHREADIPKALLEEELARVRQDITAITEGGDTATVKAMKSISSQRLLPDSVQNFFAREAERKGARIERNYEDYVAPGRFENYQQTVLVLSAQQGQDYSSHNWQTPNPVGHIRTTDRRLVTGEKSRHVEELQSDLHQEGALHGYKGDPGTRTPEEIISEQHVLQDRHHANKERYFKWWAAQSEEEKRRLGISLVGPKPDDIADPTGRELLREAQHSLQRMEAALYSREPQVYRPPRAPMEKWEEPFVRSALQNAAKDGVDLVTFPTWETLHSALKNDGTKAFYDQRLPQTLKRVAKSLGLKLETAHLSTIDKSIKYRAQKTIDLNGRDAWAIEYREPGFAKDEWDMAANTPAWVNTKAEADRYVAKLQAEQNSGQPVPAIRLTKEAKAKLREGVVMYSEGVKTTGSTPEELMTQLEADFGDGASALTRLGQLNITDTPPKWAHPGAWGLTDQFGRVTIAASNISPDMMRGLVLHEVGVHVGLTEILGRDGFEKLLDQVRTRINEGDAAALKAAKRASEANAHPAHHAEETLAYLVQFAPKTPWLQQVFADIRAWLYRTFPPMRDWMTLTDADLQSLAMGAVRARIRRANREVSFQSTKTGAVFTPPPPSSVKRFPVKVTKSADEIQFAFDVEGSKGMIGATVQGEDLHITSSELAPEARGKGLGVQMYRQVIDWAAREGLRYVYSSSKLSNESDRVYAALKRLGYKLKENPEVKRGDGAYPVSAPGHVWRLRATTLPDAPTSTSDVKYARGPRGSENPSESRGAEVSGGARQPGRADARADAGPVEGAAGGGDVGSKPQLARAVVREQIPAAPPSDGRRRWNDRISLTPEQRAERRAQFRDFVDAVEFDVEQSRGNGDFRFRNGKRTGERGAYEQLVYTLRQAEDAHPSWADAMDPETTRLEVEIHGGEATIPYSKVADEFRSTGLGQKLYTKAIDDLLARGITVNSDVSMSDGAVALWKSLRRQGYDVIQRVPDGLLERGPDNQLAASDDSTAIFFIARKKPAMPELPMSNRDVSNAIEEQRSLTEHMPACLAGKRRA